MLIEATLLVMEKLLTIVCLFVFVCLVAMDHHRPPGYGQDNYMYGDPSMGFPGNNDYGMYGSGRAMSPPPGDEEVIAGNEHLPSALEEVLAYKEHRARELGHSGEPDAEIGSLLIQV